MKHELNSSFQIQPPPNFYGNLHMCNPHTNVQESTDTQEKCEVVSRHLFPLVAYAYA